MNKQGLPISPNLSQGTDSHISFLPTTLKALGSRNPRALPLAGTERWQSWGSQAPSHWCSRVPSPPKHVSPAPPGPCPGRLLPPSRKLTVPSGPEPAKSVWGCDRVGEGGGARGWGVPAEPEVLWPLAARGGARGGAGGTRRAAGWVETPKDPDPGREWGGRERGVGPETQAGAGAGLGHRGPPAREAAEAGGAGEGGVGRAAAEQPPEGPRCGPSGSPAGEHTAPRPRARGVPPGTRACLEPEAPLHRPGPDDQKK